MSAQGLTDADMWIRTGVAYPMQVNGFTLSDMGHSAARLITKWRQIQNGGRMEIITEWRLNQIATRVHCASSYCM